MATHTEEKTFRNYNAEQAAKYAADRSMYPPEWFEAVINHHKSTGGQFHTVADVGCGPGTATRDLAPYFEHAHGVDASREMIAKAKELGGVTKAGNPIQYHLCPAEECGPEQGIADGSMDLITAATAAHWFDMPNFWRNAARMLKKDGTVALWTAASVFCHPHETPNAAEVQKVLNRIELEDLAPYEEPGNKLARTLYRTLPLPWSETPKIDGFSEEKFVRKEWNADGMVSEGGDFHMASKVIPMAIWEKMMATASPVTRWREAHPDLANTDKDCVKAARAEIEQLIGQQNPSVRFGAAIVVLYLKRV